MHNRDISNNDDLIDSRDVIARIEALEEERDNWTVTCPADCDNGLVDDSTMPSGKADCAVCDGIGKVEDQAGWTAENTDDAGELKALEALQSEAEGYADDWHHGVTLIRDSYFETYARELAEECGDVGDGWPARCIDWTQAAEELQQDYTSVDFDGKTYWVR